MTKYVGNFHNVLKAETVERLIENNTVVSYQQLELDKNWFLQPIFFTMRNEMLLRNSHKGQASCRY